MKKTNKKGFTIVELVIVIAIIAILAAVLIPTFSNVIQKANESSAMQSCTAAYQEALALALSDGKIIASESETVGNYTFVFTPDSNGAVSSCTCTATAGTDAAGYTYTFDSTKSAWTAAKNS